MTLASSAKDVKFYRWSDMNFIGVYETPVDCMSVKSISWCCEEQKILVTKSKGNPSIVEVPTKSQQLVEPHELSNITDATVGTYSQTNSQMAAFGLENGDVYVYNTRSNQRLTTESKKLPSSIQNLEFSCDDQNIAVGCANSQIFLLDSKWKPCASFVFPKDSSLSTLSYSKSAPNLLAVGSRDGAVCLWDTETIENILLARDHSGRITDLTFLGNFVASVGTDGKFITYDLRCHKINFCIELDCPLSSLAYLQGSPELALSTTTGQLRSYDLRNMSSPLRTLVANAHGGIKKIAFPNIIQDNFQEVDSLENTTKNYENDYSASGDFSILSDSSNRFSETDSKLSDAAVDFRKEQPSIKVLASPRTTIKSNELEEFSKLLEEKMNVISKEFEEKLLQTFYTLRINTSRQFIGLEGKISKSWNDFVEYLRLSGTESACNDSRKQKEILNYGDQSAGCSQ